jgi:hypothetical protein
VAVEASVAGLTTPNGTNNEIGESRQMRHGPRKIQEDDPAISLSIEPEPTEVKP